MDDVVNKEKRMSAGSGLIDDVFREGGGGIGDDGIDEGAIDSGIRDSGVGRGSISDSGISIAYDSISGCDIRQSSSGDSIIDDHSGISENDSGERGIDEHEPDERDTDENESDECDTREGSTDQRAIIINSSIISNRGYSEEDQLFQEYRNTKSLDTRNRIVGKHMYLIDIITRKFVNRGVEYEDLYQIASIALIKAVERFDLDKGVKFVSFATPTIVGEIKRYFRDKGSTIRIPRRIYEIYRKVNQAKEYLSQYLGRTPMVADIAEYLKISEENVLEIIESWNVYNMQSFEQNVYSEDNLELHETIGEEDFEFEKIENK